MNPIEDEAVIAAILTKANGALNLVDISDQLPGLKRRNGISYWRVMDKQGNWYEKHEQLPEHLKQFPTTVFPPEKVHDLHLERCFRILPHDQNTGGFFVAVLEKTLHTGRYRRPALKNEKQPKEQESKPTTENNPDIKEVPFPTPDDPMVEAKNNPVIKEVPFPTPDDPMVEANTPRDTVSITLSASSEPKPGEYIPLEEANEPEDVDDEPIEETISQKKGKAEKSS
jgi:hypothetical protein